MSRADDPQFCPECKGKMERQYHLGHGAQDTYKGWNGGKPFVAQHLSDNPETFHSRSELRRRCNELGVEIGAL